MELDIRRRVQKKAPAVRTVIGFNSTSDGELADYAQAEAARLNTTVSEFVRALVRKYQVEQDAQAKLDSLRSRLQEDA